MAKFTQPIILTPKPQENVSQMESQLVSKLSNQSQPKSIAELFKSSPVTKFSDGRSGIIVPNSPDLHPQLRAEIYAASAEKAALDKAIEVIPKGQFAINKKVDRTPLVDDDFPFDESQLAAINGMKNQKHACLTGSAGTGKTTVTKGFVGKIYDNLNSVDLASYWKSAENVGDDDNYEMPDETLVPAIGLIAFTGKACQMIKRGFPEDWHSNIMTIHRILGFYPETYYDENDLGEDGPKKKMRFIPYYTQYNKLPWEVLLIDEAGMVSTDLWDLLWDACTPEMRIYMVGDINQLPPVHGKSIFGFAMSQWPTWELTTIHRQVGINNSIVDNAWKVINGKTPVSDDTSKPDWKFVMMELPVNPRRAQRDILKFLAVNERNGIYKPLRDTVITPINGYDPTEGQPLGQNPLNEELTMLFTNDDDRHIIDAGRERKMFAVGDKVMLTKNDHNRELTNGMQGRIFSIAKNGAYMGNTHRFGLMKDVHAYLSEEHIDDGENFEDFDMDAMTKKMEMISKGKQEKEKLRGPSSHIITVRFNEGYSTQKDVVFSSLAEVATLNWAYAVTCHKMQGGEAHTIIIILHQAHAKMLYREWLYTAITRAQSNCIVLYTKSALLNTLNKQSIKGHSLEEKIKSFLALGETRKTGSKPIRLPERREI